MKHRVPGFVTCPAPHGPGQTGLRKLDDLLCRECWQQLTPETRRRLRLSGGSGRRNPADRYDELRQQLADGVPLRLIEVSP